MYSSLIQALPLHKLDIDGEVYVIAALRVKEADFIKVLHLLELEVDIDSVQLSQVQEHRPTKSKELVINVSEQTSCREKVR